MFEEVYCIVSGKVQNVMYRDFVQKRAREIGIVGSIRNLPDGTVEVTGQGTTDALKVFTEILHEGSVLSRVESVAVERRSSRMATHDDFYILY